MGALLNSVRWLIARMVMAVLILALGLGAGALRLYLKDPTDFDDRRHEQLRALNGERARLRSSIDDVQKRLAAWSSEAAAEAARTKQADGVIAQLKNLESTWDRLVGNPDQQKANAEQITRMQAVRADALARAEKAKTEYTRTVWQRDGLEIDLEKINVKVKAVEAEKSKLSHYLGAVWARWRIWVWLMLSLYVLGLGWYRQRAGVRVGDSAPR